jgi:hypothetical protein
VSDPLAYAQRLTDAILPDVVGFAPNLRVGFGFSGQNGRHPGDRTLGIVRTLLEGSLVQVADELGAMSFDCFPYLIPPTNLT